MRGRGISNTIRLAAVAIAAATLLGGCAWDYLNHEDRVSYRAGNAVDANLEQETVNPSKGSMYVTQGLGKNGAVVPTTQAAAKTTATSTSQASAGGGP